MQFLFGLAVGVIVGWVSLSVVAIVSDKKVGNEE